MLISPAPNAEVPGVLSADNNDYKSYPNYESTLGLSLEELTRIAPAPSVSASPSLSKPKKRKNRVYQSPNMTQAYRYRTNLFAEKLFLIISPSTPSGEYSQLERWLKTYVSSSNPDIFPNTTAQVGDKMPKPKDFMTRAESLARRVYLTIALIIDEVGGDEGHEGRLKGYHKNLSDALEENILLVDDLKGAVPAYFDTLHTLYTSYEVGKVVLSFTAYLTKRNKIAQVEAIEEGAKSLLQAIEMRCGEVKKGMDEGWIDKVLECVFSEGTLLNEDDDFMEEWAGEVVESWREGVIGLVALKA
jgi:N-terminal acetyltransferase B complex non-catalytic subunit